MLKLLKNKLTVARSHLTSVFLLPLDLFCRMYFFLTLKRNRFSLEKVRKVLIIKLDHIGDVLFAVPAIKALRERLPLARITMVVGPWSKEVVKNCPYVNEILFFNAHWFRRNTKGKRKAGDIYKCFRFLKLLRQRKFDLAIDFRERCSAHQDSLFLSLTGARYKMGYNIWGWGFLITHKVHYDPKRVKHEVERNLDMLRTIGIDNLNPKLEMWPGKNEQDYAQKFLEQYGVSEQNVLIGIHSGVWCPSRRWLKERFAQTADLLVERLNARVIIFGAPNEIEEVSELISLMQTEPINACGKTSLGELAALIERCKVFVGNNSGPVHIAATMETPVVDLFSGTDLSQQWGPFGVANIVIEKYVNCKPCGREECGRANHDCMELITVDEVVRAVESLLK